MIALQWLYYTGATQIIAVFLVLSSLAERLCMAIAVISFIVYPLCAAAIAFMGGDDGLQYMVLQDIFS